MFLMNEILVFSPGRRQEALDRLAWIHGLMAGQPGFVRVFVSKYLGDGTSHTILRLWQDEASLLRFRETPDGNYGRNRPEGLYVNQQVVPQWVNAPTDEDLKGGPFLIKTQREVPETAWDAFDATMAKIVGVARSAGMQAAVTLRAKDRSESLTVARFPSRSEFESFLESPEFGAARQGMPEGEKPTSTSCYEVVSEVTPKR